MRDTGRPANKVVRLVPSFRKSGTVLDVGAGFGRHAFYLAKKGFDVTASEPDDKVFVELERINRSAGSPIKLLHDSIDNLQEGKLYDLVIATMVVHFMPGRAEAHAAIEKLKQITEPGGLNCVSVMLKKESNNPRPYLFDENELAECYKGWKVLHYDEELGLPYRPSGEGEEIRSYAARIIAEKE